MPAVFHRNVFLQLFWIGVLLSLTGCAATLDVTKAPFKATTRLSEATTDAAAVLTRGTTDATKDLTAPMKQLIAHMAPGGDGQVSQKLKVVVFAIMNHENLMIDIARGGGERLEAFASLIGLPADRQSEFCRTVQGRYRWLYDDGVTPFQSLDRFLSEYYDPGWKDVITRQRA